MATKKTQELLPAYLAVGEDKLKRERVFKRMRMRLEQLGDLSFNFDRFDGSSATGEEIASACQTMPFASEKRLVFLENADKLNRKSQTDIIEYLANPSDSTVLIMDAEKLAKNTALYKAISALGKSSVIDCSPPKRYEMPERIREMAVTHGFTLSRSSAELLLSLVGEDTVHIEEELRKLAIADGGQDKVTESMIREMVAQVSEPKPYELVNAFSARDLSKTLSMLAKMPSTSPHLLLRQCVARVRELMCAKSLTSNGNASNSALKDELGLKADFMVKNHFLYARNFSEDDLRSALSSSLETERKMKSGTDADAAFKDWVIGTLRR